MYSCKLLLIQKIYIYIFKFFGSKIIWGVGSCFKSQSNLENTQKNVLHGKFMQMLYTGIFTNWNIQNGSSIIILSISTKILFSLLFLSSAIQPFNTLRINKLLLGVFVWFFFRKTWFEFRICHIGIVIPISTRGKNWDLWLYMRNK